MLTKGGAYPSVSPLEPLVYCKLDKNFTDLGKTLSDICPFLHTGKVLGTRSNEEAVPWV